MKKNKPMTPQAYTKIMHESGAVEKPHEPPSPAAIIARDKAVALAARNPLAYALGEPLPGRSMLDKLRARQAGLADNDNDDTESSRGPRGVPKSMTITPGRFLPSPRAHNTHRD